MELKIRIRFDSDTDVLWNMQMRIDAGMTAGPRNMTNNSNTRI